MPLLTTPRALAFALVLTASRTTFAGAQGPPVVLEVTPKGAPYTMPSASSSYTFSIILINNVGPISASLSVRCTGDITLCSFPGGSQSIGISAPASQQVNFTATGANGTGTLWVKATTGNPPLVDSGSINITYTPYAVTVTPQQSSVTVNPTSGGSASFTVKNAGLVSNSFTFSKTCTGASIASCGSPSPASAPNLAAGASTTVTVPYVASAITLATGTVSLTASGTNASASGAMTLNTNATAVAGLNVSQVNPGVSFDRGNCLTVAVAPQTASECGDLRIVHALPSVRTYNKSRTPILVYNSRVANIPISVNALLTVSASAVGLTSVTGTLKVAQHGVSNPPVSTATGTWPGSNWGSLTSAATRRIQLTYDPVTSGQGLYDYTFSTVRTYANNTTQQDTASGQFIVNSLFPNVYFANGWTLAGLERIQVIDSAIAWFGGDGSTQLYVPSGVTNLWKPKTYVGARDSILYDGSKYYTRHVAHGGQIVFNASGQDTLAIDRLGHRTVFLYDSFGRLSRINIPNPSADTAMYYAFIYDTTFALGQVSAPGPSGSRRLVSMLTKRLVQTASASWLQLTDPDNVSLAFTYQKASDSTISMLTSTDRRGTVDTFAFAPVTRMLSYAKIEMRGTGSDIVHTFTTPWGVGAAGPGITNPTAVVPDSAFLVVHGPRSQSGDAGDTARFWLDGYWQPTQHMDAFGSVTSIQHNNTTYPSRVTRVQDPLGRVVVEWFDQRGNDSLAIDSSFTDEFSRHPITNYRFDPKWDFLTLIDPPLHDSVSFVYDPNTGNRTSEHDARGDSTMVTFNYGNPYGLLSSIVQPDGGARDSVTYDAVLADVASTRSPTGRHVTTYTTDGLGRTTVSQTLADTGTSRIVNTTYDILDRVQSTETSSDSLTGTKQSMTISYGLDANGNLLVSQRVGTPDQASIGSLRDSAVFDRANRRTLYYAPDSTGLNAGTNPHDSTVYDAGGNAVKAFSRRRDSVITVFDALNRPVTRSLSQYLYGSRKGEIDSSFVQHVLNGKTGPSAAFNYEGSQIINSPTWTNPYPLYPNDTNNPNGYTVFSDNMTYGYDALGRLVRADNADAQVRRHYLLNGLLSVDTLKIRPVTAPRTGWDTTAHVYVTAYTYDLNSRRQAVTLPGQITSSPGGSILYGYDQAGALDSLTDEMGNLFTYTYNARGEMLGWTRAGTEPPGGLFLAEGYAYNPDGEVTTDQVVQGNTTIQLTTFLYDTAGMLRWTQNSAGTLDTLHTSYSGLGALAQGSMSSHLAFTNMQEFVDFNGDSNDAFGNRFQVVEQPFVAGIYSQCSEFMTLCGTASVKLLKFQEHTGRVLTDSIQTSPARNDTTNYDLAGNITFEFGRPFAPNGDSLVVQSRYSTGDKASYYGADGKLHAVDRRGFFPLGNRIFESDFDEYRYDALGRRVLVYTRRLCAESNTFADLGLLCGSAWARRTIWDGDAESGEIQAQADIPANAELDVGVPTNVPAPYFQQNGGVASYQDLYPFFGRVAYAYGPAGLDRPQSITRMGYTSATTDSSGKHAAMPFTIQDFGIVPIWDTQGQAGQGVFAYGAEPCELDNNSVEHCAVVTWPGRAFGYSRPEVTRFSWMGSLVEDKADPAGTLYRRNRYYDPNTGRFTQEDPIGLAGGMNAYGFANGDPINYEDPFGLKSCSELREAVTKAYKEFRKEYKKAEEFIRKGRFNKGHWQELQDLQGQIKNNINEYNNGDSNGNKCDDNDPDDPGFARTLENATAWSTAPIPMWQRLRQDIAVPTDATAVTPNPTATHAAQALTAAAIAYLIISEGSRLFPPRNLIPVP
jgi:RHS repeat-associated protein